MRLRNSSGTTLIEVLVVIVVFLVGILALVQVFPPGLTTLRKTGDMATATSISGSWTEELKAKRGELPDYIATVRHFLGVNGLTIIIDGSQPTREMMPAKDPDPSPGRIDPNGIVILGALPLADWQLVSGANRISRVIGESHSVPAPRVVGNQFGSIFHLNFGPIYYFLLPSGVGEPGVLQLYGNEMARRVGDRRSANPIPASFGQPRDWEFFFVDRAKSDLVGPFTGQDQVWLGSATAKDVRIALTFSYNGPLGSEQYSTIHNVVLDPAAPPPYATIVDNYWVVSLPQLVGQPDIHGRTMYNPASVTGVYRDSVNIQRLYQEVPVNTLFNPANPYQYKAINGNLGGVLVNPAAFDYKVRNSRGQQVPLLATADYTVLDWRIMRDEFRVPEEPIKDVKLVMSGIKPLASSGADGRTYGGLGFIGPALDTDGALEFRGDDFILLDLDTGAIVLGNMADATHGGNSYHVDKTHGYLEILDCPLVPIGVAVAYATGDPAEPWTYSGEDITGHTLRALYMARGEWSAQVYKAASRYRVTDIVAANGLQIAECYVGASRTDTGGVPIGRATRLYFPLSDLGQRVVAGEVWFRDGLGQLRLLRDQDMLLSGVENLNGVDHSYADLSLSTGGGPFDFAMGYAVKRLRGASLTVRVMNNPATFVLTSDEVENYSRLEIWSRNWRKHETESFILGGNN